MSVMQRFNPQYGTGQNLTASASSDYRSVPAGTKSLRIVNTGATNPVQVRLSYASNPQAATAADLHIPPSGVVYLTKDADQTIVAYISASGTTINIMVGEGF